MESKVQKLSIIIGYVPLLYIPLLFYFLTNWTSNLLLATYHYFFIKYVWFRVGHKKLCCFLKRLIRFYVNQNLLTRDSKDIFSPSSVFCQFLSTLNNQGISCFYKSNCICHVRHATLIDLLIFVGEQI